MKEHLMRAAKAAAGWLPDGLMAGGAAAVAYGAGLVYLPAGWMVGGLIAAGAGVLLARSKK